MIFRNGVLVAVFSWPGEAAASVATLLVLGPLMVTAALLVLLSLLDVAQKNQPSSRPLPLRSPLDLRSVLRFSALFFSLTVLSGVRQRFFGAIGFLASGVGLVENVVIVYTVTRNRALGLRLALLTLPILLAGGLALTGVLVFGW